MAVHVDREPWVAIRDAVSSASGRVVAAIGYVGKDAHTLLPLKKGDVLVCDASEVTVKSGATNPAGFVPFLDAGVEVWSEEGLHAKVVVLPKRAFVGSANASDHSATALVEASIETTVPSEVTALREFVFSRGHQRLSRADALRLAELVPKRPPRQPVARRVAAIPGDVDRLLVIGMSFGEWNASESHLYEEHHSDSSTEGRRIGTGLRLDPMSLEPWTYDRVKLGDWVVQCEDRRVYSPGIVVARARYRSARMVWIARPRTASMSVTFKEAIGAGIPDALNLRVLEGAAAQRALEVFR